MTTRRAAAVILTLSMRVAGLRVASAQPQVGSFVAEETDDGTPIFLRGAGAATNPPTLFLDAEPPDALVAKTKNSGAMKVARGNAWKEIGTWQATPFSIDAGGPFGTFVMELGSLHVWLGLANSDDHGAKFDLKVEMFKNAIAQPIADDTLRCIAGLMRDPNRATEVLLSPALTSPQLFNLTTDILRVKLSARMGTNDDDTACAGSRASAVGVRAYFDAVSRDARFTATLDPASRTSARSRRTSREQPSPAARPRWGTSSPAHS